MAIKKNIQHNIKMIFLVYNVLVIYFKKFWSIPVQKDI